MRPAPPPSDAPAQDGAFPSDGATGRSEQAADAGGPVSSRFVRRSELRRRRAAIWGAIGIVVVAAVVVAVVLLTRGPEHRVAAPGGSPASTGAPPSTVPFALPAPRVRVATTGKSGGRAPWVAPRLVRATLTQFYQLAFFDRDAWAGRTPQEAWAAFAPDVRPRAMRDAASLGLGPVPSPIVGLAPVRDSLSIQVLADPGGRPTVAFATVTLDALATLRNGQRLPVANRATYMLRPVGTAWLIVGYPSAVTTLGAQAGASP